MLITFCFSWWNYFGYSIQLIALIILLNWFDYKSYEGWTHNVNRKKQESPWDGQWNDNDDYKNDDDYH